MFAPKQSTPFECSFLRLGDFPGGPPVRVRVSCDLEFARPSSSMSPFRARMHSSRVHNLRTVVTNFFQSFLKKGSLHSLLLQ